MTEYLAAVPEERYLEHSEPAAELLDKPRVYLRPSTLTQHPYPGRARSLAAVTEYLAAAPEERNLELAAAVLLKSLKPIIQGQHLGARAAWRR